MEVNDQNMTLDQVKQWVKQFCEDRDWDPYHSPKELAIGLVTESSELLELFRFVREAEMTDMIGNKKIRMQIADELADSLYFVLRFAQLYDFDLAKCLQQKLTKNEMKYPKPK